MMLKKFTNNKITFGVNNKKSFTTPWVVAVILIIMQMVTTAFAQKITLDVKNVPLKEVLTELHKQSKFYFLYTDDQLQDSKPVTINVTEVDLENVLKQIFSSQPLNFTITKNGVVIKAKPVKLAVPIIVVPVKQVVKVTGTILSGSGVPLLGASVHATDLKFGDQTNGKGFFSLQLPIDKKIVLHVTCVGYKAIKIGLNKTASGFIPYTILNSESENLKLTPGENSGFSLYLQADQLMLDQVIIKTEKPLGTTVDLEHHSHLNLAQALDGSVPGLTLRQSNTTTSVISGTWNLTRTGFPEFVPDLLANYNRSRSQYLNNYNTPDFNSFYKFVRSQPGSSFSSTVTTTNNGLTPELRGSSSYVGNISGMLVVIDGFPKDGFPADYPMSNVATLEVIKDPAELIKWGPKAAGGMIMITSKTGKQGTVQINYSSNYYAAGPPDISAKRLQLASTREVLDYYKEQVQRGLASYITAPGILVGLKPAKQALWNLYQNGGSLANQTFAFRDTWDSLAGLNNRSQLRMLQQTALTQNQNLTIAGGAGVYRFSVNGTYGTGVGNNIKSKTSNLGFNMQNDFNLLNNKLKIKWYTGAFSNTSKAAGSDDGSSLDPYQILLNRLGGYVYNYGTSNPDQDKAMAALGYPNYGNNSLQDARENSSFNKIKSLVSRLNINWELAKGLQWSTSGNYNGSSNVNNNLQGANSSQARQLVDNYGAPIYNDPINPGTPTGVDFYVPQGAIFTKTNSSNKTWDIRTGLNYDHRFNAKNVLNVGVGISASSSFFNNTPFAPIYGYNSSTSKGLPFLMAPPTGITNYFGASQYIASLANPNLVNNTTNRNAGINGELLYTYDNRFSLRTNYGAAYVPLYGYNPPYSATKNYGATGSWMVNKERFFKLPWISTFTLSTTVSEIDLANLPTAISASLTRQPFWNNSYVSITNYNFSQQLGGSVRNIGGTAQLGFWNNLLHMLVSFNHPTTGGNQINADIGYNIARSSWFHVPVISTFYVDATLQNINPTQSLGILMGTNSPKSGGGFSLATSSNANFSQLPLNTLNKEAHITVGLNKDQFTIDLRYYNKITAGLSNVNIIADPTTGLASPVSNNKLQNKGIELYLQAKLITHKNFSWTSTINGAYNVNKAIGVPEVNFSQNIIYLSSIHNGYSVDNLFSFNWAGLDYQGNPQVYNSQHKKVTVTAATPLDSTYLSYSGKTRAPWSGGFINEWDYKSFFVTARLVFNLGYVMRKYIPVSSSELENNYLIKNRWQNPGDEAYTDIPVMAAPDLSRTFVAQNSSNSIVSANNMQLREVQLGYELPAKLLKGSFVKSMSVSMQMQNVAIWTSNNLGIDPNAISSTGIVGSPLPKQYVLSLNMSF